MRLNAVLAFLFAAGLALVTPSFAQTTHGTATTSTVGRTNSAATLNHHPQQFKTETEAKSACGSQRVVWAKYIKPCAPRDWIEVLREDDAWCVHVREHRHTIGVSHGKERLANLQAGYGGRSCIPPQPPSADKTIANTPSETPAAVDQPGGC